MSHYLKDELYELISKNHKVFDSLQQSSLDGLWYLDLENPENEWMNDKFWEILGYDPRDKKPLSSEWQDIIFPEDLQIAMVNLKKHLQDPNYKYSQIVRYKHKDGSTVWVKCLGMAIRDKDGKPIRMLGAHNDITNFKKVELELREVKSFLELTLNASKDLIFVKNKDFKIIQANSAFISIYPKDLQDKVIGYTTVEKFKKADAENFLKHDKIAFQKGFSETLEVLNLPNGKKKILDTFKVRFYDRNNQPFILGIARDVTERELLLKQIQDTNQKLKYLAYHDQTTGLANRTSFVKQIAKSIDEANKNKTELAVLLIDIDNLKFINDSFSYDTGDKLIINLAERLKSSLDKDSILARLGGDEFAILLKNIHSADDVISLINQVFKILSTPFEIDGQIIHQSVSIGAAMYSKIRCSPTKLLQFADTAMYHAKEKGKNTYSFYHKEYDEKLLLENNIEHELRSMDMKDFSMVYQPQYNKNKEICGVEALIRWNSPTLGNISPDLFIAIAEKTGKIAKIGSWIITQVIHDWKQLNKLNLISDLKISINISSIQLLKNEFVDEIINKFENIDKSLITFEITETYLLNDINHTRSIITKLNSLGFSFALDDFGTGYSSLKYLANLPIKYLKIDKSFIHNIDQENNKTIIKAIIQLADNLNKKCIAEGVETEQELKFLESVGCNLYQGFYFSKPLPFIKLKKLLQSHHQTKI
ncbi:MULTISPECIES: sensor domain-containing protein [unclassified Francisella]|uniref:sensor domain-containing protein n=1 Tax=unclassified Francisella TaxID=2610885 RepID=UPI002E36D308|nr:MULTISPECIES: EAL domain-containing protein [unclassified Francisella]MED7820111.1 EAL domain-containing protein [Francisella sp. 19S2-4]MED7830931.1 EAL domain-containing protein [Francisella sp. 19S2-10]